MTLPTKIGAGRDERSVTVTASTASVGRDDIDTKPTPAFFIVIFEKRTHIYNTGEIASFPLQHCWKFVKAGRARWAPDQHIPAEPDGELAP